MTENRHAGMGFGQFVAMIAALMAVNALAIDAMLPALGRIGDSLGIAVANERQWVVTAYVLGFGAAQIFYGTLADRFGRRATVFVALGVYVAASLWCAVAGSFEALLLARVVEGLGAAGTRVLAVSIVRDCYEGRKMARVMSLSLLVFLGVPILAPSLGQLVMLVAPWRVIFVVLTGYAVVVGVWIKWKLPETLDARDRRPIAFAAIFGAARMTLTNRASVGYTLAMTLVIGSWLGFLNSSQQVFADVFHQPGLFTLVFAMIAGGIAAASIVNARLVNRLGSRKISHAALLVFIFLAIAQAAVAFGGVDTMWRFAALQMAMMFCFGLMMGNFGAMSMAPLGHVAGSAASIQGLLSTLGGAVIGLMIGQNFDSTILPMTLGFAVCGGLAMGAVVWAEGGRLFAPQETNVAFEG
jgi:DHA1 family bicyclomycin/chloramphenicol resistance-like MFS transporter